MDVDVDVKGHICIGSPGSFRKHRGRAPERLVTAGGGDVGEVLLQVAGRCNEWAAHFLTHFS